MRLLRMPTVKLQKVAGRTYHQGALKGFRKMTDHINDNVNKKTEATKPVEQLDLLSVMKDNGDSGVGQMTEIERQIKEVSDVIASVAKRMASLPPEWQQVMKSNAELMAAKGEPAYQQFIAKC